MGCERGPGLLQLVLSCENTLPHCDSVGQNQRLPATSLGDGSSSQLVLVTISLSFLSCRVLFDSLLSVGQNDSKRSSSIKVWSGTARLATNGICSVTFPVPKCNFLQDVCLPTSDHSSWFSHNVLVNVLLFICVFIVEFAGQL